MSSESLLIAQLTDTHLFADEAGIMMGVQTAKTLRTVIERIKTLFRKPDLLLLTGDITQDETPGSYARLREAVQSLQIPTYWLPGNHDVPAVMQTLFQGKPFFAEKSLQAGGWNIVLLDSVVPGRTDGVLDPAQLEFLDQQLAAFSELPTLVALHHPPCLIGSTWMDAIGLQQAEAFYAVLDRYSQVKIVLFGHIHQAFEGDRRGVRYLGSPSACMQFKPRSATLILDETPPGLRLLEIFPDGQFTTQVEWVPFEVAALHPVV